MQKEEGKKGHIDPNGPVNRGSWDCRYIDEGSMEINGSLCVLMNKQISWNLRAVFVLISFCHSLQQHGINRHTLV